MLPVVTRIHHFVTCCWDSICQFSSVFLELISCFLLFIATFMADDPAPKRVRRAIGTVCEACGKHFDTSYGFDKHRTSGI